MLLWMSLALAADTMRLTVELTDDGPVVVHSTHLLQPPAPARPGGVVVFDGDGAPLASVELPPLASQRTLVLPHGGHEVVEIPTRFVTVDVPWTPSASDIQLGGTSFSPVPDLLRPPPMEPAIPIWETGGTDKRLDLVLFAEGYTSGQEALFAADAETLMRDLLNEPPFDRYRALVNVWTVFLESETTQVGSDQTPNDNTALGCFDRCSDADIERLLCCDEARLQIVRSHAAPFADGVLVVANSAEYGGSGGLDYSVVSVERQPDGRPAPGSGGVAIHELAHHLFLLWDEYAFGADDGRAYISPNCSPPDETEPWAHWQGEPGIGRFEPCHFDTWVSATRTCMMQNIHEPFCPVCAEHIVRDLYAGLPGSMTSGASPEPGVTVVDGLTVFSVDVSAPELDLQLQWTLDGEVISESSEARVPGCSAGESLVLTLHDPTELVRADPHGHLTQALSWDLRCPGDELEVPGGCRSVDAPPWLALLVLAVPRRRRRDTSRLSGA